ncbi:MAG: thioredoxin family protein, partial [Planctomycetales bacterium]|nr:thioredoxin family protein [Planctomycetales bacterium]
MWQCALLALAAVGGDGQTVLLDFYSERCPPCRRMAPIVAALEEQGLPIRKVNVDQEPQLAQQYGVSGIPCFVMLAGGREIDRVVGATEPNRLAAMFASARTAAPKSPAMAPAAAQSPIAAPTNLVSLPSSRPPSAPPQAAGSALDARLIEASVRIRTEDAQGFSVGSGTI